MATRQTQSLARLMRAPAIILLLVWMLVPLAMTLYYSFLNYNLLSPGQTSWAGFFNYQGTSIFDRLRCSLAGSTA